MRGDGEMTVTPVHYIHLGQIVTNPGALKLVMTPHSIVTHHQLCIVPALASYQYGKDSHRTRAQSSECTSAQ